MAPRKKVTKKKKQAFPEPTKRDLKFLQLYFDSSDLDTYFNGTQCALKLFKTCSYSSAATRGAEILKKHEHLVNQWLEDAGLSVEAIKARYIQLAKATTTKFFSDKGIITDEVEVNDNAIQAKMIIEAAKMRGMYAPEKHEHSGKVILSAPPITKADNSGE